MQLIHTFRATWRRVAIAGVLASSLVATTNTGAHADPVSDLLAQARSILATAVPGEPLKVVVTSRTSDAPEISSVVAPSRAGALSLITSALGKSSTVGVDIAHTVRMAATNDPYRSRQWAMSRFGAEKVWKKATGRGVVVAVVDTGVQANHADLKGHVLAGRDFVAPGTSASDENGHGTHVAGIISAVANNKRGIAGLAPSSRILPVRVLDNRGEGSSDDVAKGIIWAVKAGAKVINLSLGSSQSDTAGQQAIAYAVSKNVVVVAAAGNDGCGGGGLLGLGGGGGLLGLGGPPHSYPAEYPNVLAVGAINSDGSVASYSNCGEYVDVVAPGSSIVSTMIGNPSSQLGCQAGSGYCYLSGTSMATPYTAAAAALKIEQLGKGWKQSTVRSRLQSTATDIQEQGRDDRSGYGIINPARLLSIR